MKVKKRSPRLTRLEKLTKGLASDPHKYKSRFSIHEVKDKGRSLFLHKGTIKKDSFVLEYEGDLIPHSEAEMREATYELNKEGCYILFFKFQGKKLAIDATRQYKSYARYLNHSRQPNIKFHTPIVVDLDGQNTPRIAAFALRDIHEGEEIVFDYGVRDTEISWLKNTQFAHTSELPPDSSDSESCSDEENMSDTAEISVYKTGITPCHRTLPTVPLCSAASPSTVYSKSTISSSLPIADSTHSYGFRFIPNLCPLGMGASYYAMFESLPEPEKILRFMDDSGQKKTADSRSQTGFSSKCSRPPSVISVSGSDSQTKCSSPSQEAEKPLISFSDVELPMNKEPTSASKVMEWQCQNTQIAHDMHSDIKILEVKSLGAMQSYSDHCSSSFSVSSGNVHSPLPQVVDVMCGSMVPQEYTPCMGNSSFVTENKNSDVKGLPAPSIVQHSTKSDINSHFINRDQRCQSRPQKTDAGDSVYNTKYTGDFYGTLARLSGRGFQLDSVQETKTCYSASSFSKEYDQKINKVCRSETQKVDTGAKRDSKAIEIEQIEILSSSSSDNDVEEVIVNVEPTPSANIIAAKTLPLPSVKISKGAFGQSSEDLNHTNKNIYHATNVPSSSSTSSSSSSKHLDPSDCSIKYISSLPSTSTSQLGVNVKDIKSSCQTSTSLTSASRMELEQDCSKSTIDSAPVTSVSSSPSALCQNLSSPPVAVIAPFKLDVNLKDEEKRKLMDILGPQILSNDTSTESIKTAICKNWEFFKVLITRGVTINDIRASVRKFAKSFEKERRRNMTD